MRPADVVLARNGNAPDSEAARLLTADDLALRWQVPKSHVYRLAREGVVPAVKLGRYTRFRLDAVEAFERAGGGGSE